MAITQEFVQQTLKSIYSTFFNETQPNYGIYLSVMVPLVAVMSVIFASSAQWFAETFGKPFAKNPEAAKAKYNKPTENYSLNASFNHFTFGVDGAVWGLLVWYSRTMVFDLWDVLFHFTWGELALHLPVCAFYLAVSTLIYDGQIYVFHRLEHEIPFLYRVFHKQHHENDFPSSVFDGAYGDTLEAQIIAAFAMWPVLVLPVPFTVQVFFMSFVAFMVQINHSGHHIKIWWLNYDSYSHLLHHQKRLCNYGEHTWVWDWLCGTLNLKPITLEAGEGKIGTTIPWKDWHKKPQEEQKVEPVQSPRLQTLPGSVVLLPEPLADLCRHINARRREREPDSPCNQGNTTQTSGERTSNV